MITTVLLGYYRVQARMQVHNLSGCRRDVLYQLFIATDPIVVRVALTAVAEALAAVVVVVLADVVGQMSSHPVPYLAVAPNQYSKLMTATATATQRLSKCKKWQLHGARGQW